MLPSFACPAQLTKGGEGERGTHHTPSLSSHVKAFPFSWELQRFHLTYYMDKGAWSQVFKTSYN